jgi:predicted RecB family nuclease
MAATIPREVLEGYLACRHKGRLKLAREQGERSEYEILLSESRERVCQAATEKLLAGQKEGEVPRGCTATAELLGRGLPLLLDVSVEGEGLAVRFDALQRAAGKSSLGDFHYQPVLFHEGERPGRGQKALLELLGLVLGAAQGKEPERGMLFHGRDCQARRVKLGPGVAKARRTLEEIGELQEKPPRLTLNDHCQVCEFRRRCHAEATAKDDLSLLRGMSHKEISKYGRRGIFTVTQLSCTFRSPRRKGKRSKQRKQPHQHALQALSVREKKIHILGTPELPDARRRIYFDIEGDPERRFDYLLGVIVTADGAEERHSFWADGPADEPRVFQQFLDLVGCHKDAWFYTYGSYEATFLRRLAKDSGREGVVRTILARTFNVLSVIYPHVYFPTYSNGLKDIAGYLGFNWTAADASGIQSIVWRRRWEETGSAAMKEKLTTYNLEDCAALRKVTEFLYKVCPDQSAANSPSPSQEGQAVTRVEEMASLSNRPEWRQSLSTVPDFDFINERAYFDYQRDKVFIRTSKPAKNRKAHKRNRSGKKDLRANRCVEIGSQACPSCKGTNLIRTRDTRLARLAVDLRITRSGIRRWVTRFTTTWHSCAGCGCRFLPADYLRLQEHFHTLKSWAMYEYVAHRKTQANIAETLKEYFGLPISTSQVSNFKQLLGRYYEGTYKQLLERIVGGNLVHADETEITVKKVGKGYVWVLTNMEEVVYMYRKSREGDFLHDLLKGFRGVLVSDFYAAYDSLPCEQQKCLIHLIRDINTDVKANPWDEELKTLASGFGTLLRAIVATIDQYGLKTRHLGKHKGDVDKFFQSCKGQNLRSEVAEGLRKRLLKCQDKLFTFMGHDGIPWNNNNAEHAVKRFAQYREITDGQVTEDGLNDYLVLLSVFQSCKYKGVSFLKFLLSQETDIDVFRERGGKKRPVSAVEIHAEGRPWLPNRKRVDARPSPVAGDSTEEVGETPCERRDPSQGTDDT